MDQIQKYICAPATVYLIVALVITTIWCIVLMTIPGAETGAISSISSSNLLLILSSTLILMGICTLSPIVTWVVVIILVACNITSAVTYGVQLYNDYTQKSQPVVVQVITPTRC